MESKDFAGPVNLGNPVEISVKQLAEEIIELTGSSSKIIFKKLPQDDPKQRCPDISIAKDKLSWTPKINRDIGLKKTIRYFDTLLKS
jgi:UDP-glucuronate decarboxylase